MHKKYNTIVDGVFTILTPYTADSKVDYKALEDLIVWYKKKALMVSLLFVSL